jgi:dipeptidyl aminopeptidase/acylaminoacyl peptidase
VRDDIPAPAPGLDPTLPPDLEQWVVEHLTRCRAPGENGIEDVSEVARHPELEVVACTVAVRQPGEDPPVRRHVALVELTTGRHRLVDVGEPGSGGAAWSPDGRRLALVATPPDRPGRAVVTEETDWSPTTWLAGHRAGRRWRPVLAAEPRSPGLVETCTWSPSGARLALSVALPGAGISDVHGTGTIGGPDAPAWRPHVLPAPTSARRVVCLWSHDQGDRVERVDSRNVWELAWSTDDALVLLTSEGGGEGAWYAPHLERLDLVTGRATRLYEPSHQLAQPRSAPDGSRWSVLSAVQSDRGLPAGDLVVGRDREHWVSDTRGVSTTDHHWVDDRTVLLTGLRGLRTVVASLDVEDDTWTEVWEGEETTGEHQPEVAAVRDRAPVVVLEAHRRPPALGVLEPEGFRPVLEVSGPGADHQAAVAGETAAITWTAADGLEIEGLVTLPRGPGPHPLVVGLHGGPVHAWRATWAGRDPHVSVLVARGYAVLRPNPRGSTGRGSEFVAKVYGDMGGRDVDDVLAGVRFLVDTGVADRDRVGVTGISYGGFLACWLPCVSDVFAAAVARSPVTDWVTQHLTSNIPEFDAGFLGGDWRDPSSPYRTRSPLAAVERCWTPLLLTAGLMDLATPPSQAHVMHTALVEQGIESALAVYPDQGHGVWSLETLVDQCTRMLAWFERFMPPDPSVPEDSAEHVGGA